MNIPPTVVPATYITSGVTYNWSNAIVNIIQSYSTVIAWTLLDSDTPQSNLTSLIYGLPYRGLLYYCVEINTGGYAAGLQITESGAIVNASSDGLFRVVYIPEADTSGQNYATFSVVGKLVLFFFSFMFLVLFCSFLFFFSFYC